jgi:protein regulator of cytokinesis 1
MSSDTSSTALTALLDSLHTHLQAQTQLLPTLHAQLGLPNSALEDELTALQAQLAATVDAQLSARREQVEQWMQKCAAVESACGRYCTALGTHVKAAGPSLKEIRTQTVLPRQYELLSSYQEKLRQVQLLIIGISP